MNEKWHSVYCCGIGLCRPREACGFFGILQYLLKIKHEHWHREKFAYQTEWNRFHSNKTIGVLFNKSTHPKHIHHKISPWNRAHAISKPVNIKPYRMAIAHLICPRWHHCPHGNTYTYWEFFSALVFARILVPAFVSDHINWRYTSSEVFGMPISAVVLKTNRYWDSFLNIYCGLVIYHLHQTKWFG